MPYMRKSRRSSPSSTPPERRRLAVTEWPAADQALWQAAVARRGPDGVPGPGGHWRHETLRAREGAWGQYLGYLKATGDLHDEEEPHQRLTFERLTGHLRAARAHCTDFTVHQQVRELFFIAKAMMPGRDWSWIERHPAGPSHSEAQASRKPKVPLDPVLLQLALDTEFEACDSDQPSLGAARRFRDALMAMLLLYHPIRRANLVDLRLGVHLRAEYGVVRLVIDGEETKNYQPIDHLVKEPLLGRLLRYLGVHRPRLLAGKSRRGGDAGAGSTSPVPAEDHVWISERGKPVSYPMFFPILRDLGLRLIGRPINPHVFRHTFATAILAADPTRIELVRDGLGHRNVRITNQYYDRSGYGPSQDLYTRHITELRAAKPGNAEDGA